jgi:hypothetical protein
MGHGIFAGPRLSSSILFRFSYRIHMVLLGFWGGIEGRFGSVDIRANLFFSMGKWLQI